MKVTINDIRDPDFLKWLYEETLENAVIRAFPEFQKVSSTKETVKK